MIWRWLPLAGIILLVGISLGWRAWLQHRRWGTWGILLFRSGSIGQKIRDGMLVIAGALLAEQAIEFALWPRTVHPLVAIPSPGREILRILGAVVMSGGLVLLVVAQLDLGASWRIGIDETARPGLVTSGLYRYSRNPIFLGLLLIVAGYTLQLPTLLSLVLLAGFYLGARQQIAAEQVWLLRTYGAAYRDYARRVGRLMPGLGRLRED